MEGVWTMARIPRVSATEFAREFLRFAQEVQSSGVMEITEDGRTVGAFLSADELARFDGMKSRELEEIRSEIDAEPTMLIRDGD
jgi:hypothetical protein